MSVETLIIIAAVVFWFAHGWHLNQELKSVNSKLDRVLDQFGGLRRYLYEIDPQFDDERQSRKEFFEARSEVDGAFAALDDIELLKTKEADGRRTLNTPFA